MDMNLEGMEQLVSHLRKLSNSADIEKKALLSAGEHFKEKVESNVYSYGLKKRTGRSQKSFVLSREVRGGKVYVGLSNQNNDAFYLYFHEFGTSKMKARPFMRPTFEQEKRNIERILADEIRKGLGL